MGLADKVGTGEVVKLDPSTLKPGPSIRREKISIDHVNRLRPVLDACPPITVAAPSMTIVDGHHRAAAARQEHSVIRAVLVALPPADLLEAAVKANVTHGLLLTSEERKSAALRMVKDNADWSDSRIAAACGISDKTVAGIRPTSEAPKLDTPAKREGSDGRRRPARPAEQREKIDEELKADPEASDRKVAERTGASPTTVGARRRHMAAVPDTPAEAPPTVDEIVILAPVEWAADERCQRSDATREFGRFMDRFTRWNGKSFFESIDEQAPECPADLRIEAADVANSMSAAWNRLAMELTKTNLTEAK